MVVSLNLFRVEQLYHEIVPPHQQSCQRKGAQNHNKVGWGGIQLTAYKASWKVLRKNRTVLFNLALE